MYFGSVRFFRHLIITVVLLLIIIPVTICIALSGQIREKDLEIEDLNSKKNAVMSLIDVKNGVVDLSAFTAEEFRNLLNAVGVTDSELVEVILKNNGELKESIQSAQTTVPPESGSEGNSDNSKTSGTVAGTSEKSNTSTASQTSAPDTSAPAATTDTTKPVQTTAVTTTTAATTATEPAAPSYTELYPDLYVDSGNNGEYDNNENYIYLTFDDGPSGNTTGILHYLDKHDVKATFFVVPDNTEGCKKTLNKLLDNGHAVGIHTASHDYKKIYESVEAYLEDFYTAFKMVEEQTGHRPYLFRFPGGSKNDYNTEIFRDLINEMSRRGFVYFDWNVDSRDSLGSNWTQMYNTVLSEVAQTKNAVVLFHDGYGRENTVLVIEDVIKALKNEAKGYTFSAINEKTRPVHF